MSAEPRQITNPEPWTQWEGKLVNGTWPLRRFLGGSDHSGVFLTEQRTENLREVAIKFIPAETVQAEAQLVQWAATTALVHPNLVRIFDVGRYRSNGRDFLFVVMEHAEQTLAEILPRRPLAPEEVKIDRSFITGLLASEADQRIVRSTIQLAHAVNAVVTAEGVEDKGTLAWLREAGCENAQGYGVGRAVDAESLIRCARAATFAT